MPLRLIMNLPPNWVYISRPISTEKGDLDSLPILRKAVFSCMRMS